MRRTTRLEPPYTVPQPVTEIPTRERSVKTIRQRALPVSQDERGVPVWRAVLVSQHAQPWQAALAAQTRLLLL